MDLESGVLQNQPNSQSNSTNKRKAESWLTVLSLSFQSLGVVYGDLSTSPLYVYKSTFSEDISHSETNEEIFGVLSFVFWTLTLVPLLKYVFIVLQADDNGEGGTFALYSLLCRHARVNSLLPNCQLADRDISDYYYYSHSKNDARVKETTAKSCWLRSLVERHGFLQRLLLVLALIGTCMLIGDGVLTPAISVFSAISGLELSMSKEQHNYFGVPIACFILICLFSLQHYGTHRVGFLFAPIVMVWLLCISAIGVYNIFKWNHQVYRALSPHYMYDFLKKTRTRGWLSLGGILLCVTGSEAMFADLGHFSQLSIKIAFTSFVYPALVLAYMGQAAYLSQHHFEEKHQNIGFYVSVPETLRWPVLVIAVLAAVVGSQAIITGTFSIIKQCSALGCFPKVKIVHTSSKFHGQIYIPDINWMLMILCLAVTIGFRDTRRLGNAAGLAVITVMLVTTCLMFLVIVLCWNRSIFVALLFVAFFGSIEALYFSASLVKFLEGAWFPIALSAVFVLVMYVWHYGTIKKYEFEIHNKVSLNWLLTLGPSLGIVRVRGLGIVHTELVSGIPAIFSHFVTNVPAFHQVLVFLCIKSVPVPHVRPEERFLVGRIGPSEYHLYRCIVRYGYRDFHKDDMEFENDLVCSIAEFIRLGNGSSSSISSNTNTNNNESALSNESTPSRDGRMTVVGTRSCSADGIQMGEDDGITSPSPPQVPPTQHRKRVRFVVPESPKVDGSVKEELAELREAKEAGVAYILGNTYMRSKQGSGVAKRLAIDYGYEFLRRNSRGANDALSMPQASSLEVGMVYHV